MARGPSGERDRHAGPTRYRCVLVSKESGAAIQAGSVTQELMSEFQTVATVGEIPEGEGRAYQVGERKVAVFLVNGEYSAINDVCMHMGASLASGYVENGAVTCP